MNKIEIYHLLKSYRYIVEAVQKELDVEIRISGRKKYIAFVNLERKNR